MATNGDLQSSAMSWIYQLASTIASEDTPNMQGIKFPSIDQPTIEKQVQDLDAQLLSGDLDSTQYQRVLSKKVSLLEKIA